MKHGQLKMQKKFKYDFMVFLLKKNSAIEDVKKEEPSVLNEDSLILI